MAILAGALLAGCGGSADVASTSAPDRGPRLLDLQYGNLRAPGASERLPQVRLRVVDPDGQIIGFGVDGVHADGGCGLGGRRNGEPVDDYLPMTLSPGRHRLTIVLTSSTCTGDPRIERRTFTRVVDAP